MLEKPNLPDEALSACLEAEYGLRVDSIAFLPLGADRNTAVYRAAAGMDYFIKLRCGAFEPASVAIPHYLSEQGVTAIIPPQTTLTGELWAELPPFRVIVYAFIEGDDAYTTVLSDAQWIEFGAAVRRIHTISLPPALARLVKVETFSRRWPSALRDYLLRIERDDTPDSLARDCAMLLRAQLSPLLDLLNHTQRLADALRSRLPARILCHSDLHGGNLHIAPNGQVYIVDWDAPILAPRERDLMYPGGGQFGEQRSPAEEERFFYQGYGPVRLDRTALAYYRCNRIVEDLAVECELIFDSNTSSVDRQRELGFMQSNFQPGGVLELAFAAAQAAESSPGV